MKIDLKTKTSNLGIWIGDKNYQKKGVASETLSESINFIFNKKLVNKFVLGVCVANLKAIKLYKKLGFKKKSKINNVLNMSLTKINFFIKITKTIVIKIFSVHKSSQLSY